MGLSNVNPALILASYIFWWLALFFGKKALHHALLYWCGDVPFENVRIPGLDQLPVVDPPGKSIEFNVLLDEATEEEIDAFLKYRGRDGEGEVAAFQEAIALRAELSDVKLLTSFLERQTKGNMKHPVVQLMQPWSGWQGWYVELGEFTQKWICGNIMYALQHGFTGLVAAVFLFIVKEPAVVRFAIYSDLGFNLVDLGLMIVSVATGWDLTILSGIRTRPVADGEESNEAVKGVFLGLIVHHFGAAMLELVGLMMDRHFEFSAEMMVALLGTTGMLHFFAQVIFFTPARENESVMFFTNYVISVVFSWYRGIYWVWLMLKGSFLAFVTGGPIVGSITAFAFAFFSLFNIRGTQSYFKATVREWKNWVQSKNGRHFFGRRNPKWPSQFAVETLVALLAWVVFEMLKAKIMPKATAHMRL